MREPAVARVALKSRNRQQDVRSHSETRAVAGVAYKTGLMRSTERSGSLDGLPTRHKTR